MAVFDISYIVLWGFMLLQAVILRQVLRETVWLKHLYGDFALTRRWNQLPRGTLAPEFVAPILQTGGEVTTADLRGRPTTLMFISTADAASPLYKELLTSIHGLWHRAEGNLYIVCSGATEQCRQMIPELRFGSDHETSVPVIIDSDGGIARAFLVSRTPTAVTLDEQARIERYGFQLTAIEVEQRQQRLLV